jgi:hypothetical protein
VTVLQKKAIENRECAYYAVKNELFNVAISRFYYWALISSKNYLVTKKGVSEEELQGSAGASSHDKIIDGTIRALSSDPNSGYKYYGRVVKRFNELKDMRNRYEYDTNFFCDKKEYDREYKILINQFIDALICLDVIRP